jgi:hypothetical protein
LADVVLEHLDEDAVLSQLALSFAERAATLPPVADVLDLMTDAPAILESVRVTLETQSQRQPRRIDYLGLG